MLCNLAFLLTGCIVFGAGVFVGFKIWGPKELKQEAHIETSEKPKKKDPMDFAYIPNDEAEAIEEEEEKKGKK